MNNKIKTLLITTTLSIGLGQTSHADRTYMCKPCPEGTFANNNQCEKCPAGNSCASGVKTECPNGYFSVKDDSECHQCTFAVSMTYRCEKCSELDSISSRHYCIQYNGLNPSIYHELPSYFYYPKTIRENLTTGKHIYKPYTSSYSSIQDYYSNCYENKMEGVIVNVLGLTISHDSIYDVEIPSCDKTNGKATTVNLYLKLYDERPSYMSKDKITTQQTNRCNSLKNEISKQIPNTFKIISHKVVSQAISKTYMASDYNYENVCQITLQQQ